MNETNQIPRMNEIFDETEAAQYMKSFMFIKGFAIGRSLNQTMLALSLARQLHDGQYRKDGTPYISHPLKVCTTLISYGVEDDVTLSAALLHDVLEDCKDRLPLQGRELVSEYHFAPEILEIIRLLTKESGLGDRELGIYFKKIEENPKAALVKLSDRLHNSSTLYTFTFPKMRKYIRETSMFLIPMASYCKKYYPEYANAFAILKSNIESMNRSMDVMLSKIEEMGNMPYREYKVYFDMDGVLADFDRGVEELAGFPRIPQDCKTEEQDDRMWEAIGKVEHFYDRLELMPGAREMFDMAYRLCGGQCEILTGIPKPRRGITTAGEDKAAWVKRMLGADIRVNIVFREEKKKYCTGAKCILIDDLEENIVSWREHGGTGILHRDAGESMEILKKICIQQGGSGV